MSDTAATATAEAGASGTTMQSYTAAAAAAAAVLVQRWRVPDRIALKVQLLSVSLSPGAQESWE